MKRIQILTPSQAAREQDRVLIEAKSTILSSGDFLPATEVAKLAGFTSTNLSVQPNKWKRNREFFAIQRGREDYLPLYGSDPADHRPRKEMAEILKTFGDAKDGWGLAFWFAGLNSFLDDERSQDVLATDLEQVIVAAKDEMAELRRKDRTPQVRDPRSQDIFPSGRGLEGRSRGSDKGPISFPQSFSGLRK